MRLRHVTLAAATGALMICGAAAAEAAEPAPHFTSEDNDQGRSIDTDKEARQLTHNLGHKASTPVHMARYVLSPRPPY
ncbi:hypothetical protein ACFVT5_38950 [Streptomyces sp. NPDC058001]|uniref:hypothetical protein n=1 Tax=Streptomyces sp. NPDC058001 TaxID=3346300 RepID=UPI0036EBC2F5